MLAAVISKETRQMQLDFEPGLTERYSSLRDVVATGVYRRGLKRIAADLDMAPSNLSVQLSDDPSRHFSVDSLEKFIAKTGDLSPVYYLIEKYLDGGKKAPPTTDDLIAKFAEFLKSQSR